MLTFPLKSTAGTGSAFTKTHWACSCAGSLLFTQLLFSGWVEGKRWADLYNPGSQGDGSFLGITSGFKPVSNGYPGTHNYNLNYNLRHSPSLLCTCCCGESCRLEAMLVTSKQFLKSSAYQRQAATLRRKNKSSYLSADTDTAARRLP